MRQSAGGRSGRRARALLAVGVVLVLGSCDSPFGLFGNRAPLDPPPGTYSEPVTVRVDYDRDVHRVYWSDERDVPLSSYRPLWDLQISGTRSFWYFAVSASGERSALREARYVIEDTEPPTIAADSRVFFGERHYFGYRVRWQVHPWADPFDAVTPWEKLEYLVVSSATNNVGTASEALANGRVEMEWRRQPPPPEPPLSHLYTASRPGERRWFNVLVRDQAGNTSSYGQRLFSSPPLLSVYTAGDTDLLWLNTFNDEFGEPTFMETVAAPPGPTRGVALGRIDGDLIDDLAIVYHDGTNDRIGIILGSEAGAYPPTRFVRLYTDAWVPAHRPIAIADLTGPRQVVTISAAGDILILSPTAGLVATIPAAGPPFSGFAVGDIDGDGRPDVVGVSLTAPTLRVFRNLGGGAFGLAWSGGPAGPISDVEIADLNGNRRGDVIVVGPTLTPRVQIFYSEADGTLTPDPDAGLQPFAGIVPYGVVAADFTRNGLPDLFVSTDGNGDERSRVYRNDGTGILVADAQVLDPGGPGRGAFAADLNGNGLIDVIELFNGEAPRIWLNSGTDIVEGPTIGDSTTTWLAVGQVR